MSFRLGTVFTHMYAQKQQTEKTIDELKLMIIDGLSFSLADSAFL